jgi:hypothetical protein
MGSIRTIPGRLGSRELIIVANHKEKSRAGLNRVRCRGKDTHNGRALSSVHRPRSDPDRTEQWPTGSDALRCRSARDVISVGFSTRQ